MFELIFMAAVLLIVIVIAVWFLSRWTGGSWRGVGAGLFVTLQIDVVARYQIKPVR